MNKKYLSIGVCYESLNRDKILEKNISIKYPGAMWVPLLNDICENFEIHTSDVVLDLILKKIIKPIDVCLYCDESVLESSKQLIDLGCKPLVLSSFESPIYSRKFYREIDYFKKLFKYKILFKGAINHFDNNSEELCFPTFSTSSLNFSEFKNKLEKYVLVMSNKYYTDHKSISSYTLRFLKNSIPFYKNRFTSFHKSIQLYDKRLDIITNLAQRDKIQLFGGGWHDITNIPKRYKAIISSTNVLNEARPINYEEKLDLLSKYKFCLCIENCAYEGYVTEKIIDAIYAKTLPVYLGAPDIANYIPKGCFIDLNDFKNINDGLEYIESIGEKEYSEFISNGHNFINGEEGKKFSYEYFSQKINKILNYEFYN